MSPVKLSVRLRDVTGALERLLGTLRRRAVVVERMSVSRGDADALEVVIVVADKGIAPSRVVAELCHLQDVQFVARIDGPLADESRELALARLRRSGAPWPPDVERLIRSSQTDDSSLADLSGHVVELTGTPRELDEALKLMKESGTLSGVSRSGEVLPPANPTLET